MGAKGGYYSNWRKAAAGAAARNRIESPQSITVSEFSSSSIFPGSWMMVLLRSSRRRRALDERREAFPMDGVLAPKRLEVGQEGPRDRFNPPRHSHHIYS
jgi:hypothetical protein